MQRIFSTVSISLCLLAPSLASAQSLFDPENARVSNAPARPGGDKSNVPQNISKLAFPLTKQNGPILVKVASFIGDEHLQYANALCQELRQRYQLNAYAFSYKHEIEGLMTEEEAEQFDAKYMVRPRRRVPQTEPPVNWVVMVGDFKSFDDPNAQKTLEKVRKLDVKSIPQNIWDQYKISAVEDVKAKAKKQRPLNSAMLVPNPHPEAPKFEKQISDEMKKMILNLNTDSPFSIYENPHPYTLAIAEFRGGSFYGETENAKLFNRGKLFTDETSPLQQAAKQAIGLAEALRKLGWEAYVFHGQYASIVCVGGFPEKADMKNPRMQDLRVRIELMNQRHEVVELREKLAKVTLAGTPLSPHAELILTPRPPQLGNQSLRTN
jgi:hypothetical protein